jgi:hypothetical protein
MTNSLLQAAKAGWPPALSAVVGSPGGLGRTGIYEAHSHRDEAAALPAAGVAGAGPGEEPAREMSAGGPKCARIRTNKRAEI